VNITLDALKKSWENHQMPLKNHGKIMENHFRCPKSALDFDGFEWENHGKITLDALKYTLNM
jgi:hypothetical protein